MWHAFEKGQTLGSRGPGQGVVVLDEEHPLRARMTLERDGHNAHPAPWSITCGLGDTFAHTAFASSEAEARSKYADMKRDLTAILEENPSCPCYEKIRLFMAVY